MHSLPLSNFGATASVIYSIDGENHRVLRYTPNQIGTATLDSTLNLPVGLTPTLVTTDAGGDLYIGGYTTSVERSEVLVFDAGASDDDLPLRTLTLMPGKLTALALDRQRVIYAAQWSNAQQNHRAAINIYSNNPGEDKPIRTIAPASLDDIYDLAVDSAGHVYVSSTSGSASFIGEFSATARGDAAALRTVWAPQGSNFGGLAVDDSGYIFVMLGLSICKLAPGAIEMPETIGAINLPARFTPYSKEAYPNILRRDGLGDFFVPVTMTGPDGSANMVYGFSAYAGGDATPMLQFAAQEATASGPHEHNIPLAVF